MILYILVKLINVIFLLHIYIYIKDKLDHFFDRWNKSEMRCNIINNIIKINKV